MFVFERHRGNSLNMSLILPHMIKDLKEVAKVDHFISGHGIFFDMTSFFDLTFSLQLVSHHRGTSHAEGTLG